MLRTNKIAVIIVIALCAVGVVSWGKTDWDQQAAQRKAEYVFIESQNAYGTDRIDDYVHLLNYAYQLDSADTQLASEWAFLRLGIGDVDSLEAMQAYALMKRQFTLDPSDYVSDVIFANTAKRLGQYADHVRAWEIIDSVFPTYDTPPQELASAYLLQYLLGDTAAYQKAINIYNRLELGTGKDLSISSQKIRAYLIKKDTAAVIKEIEEVAANAPGDSYAALFVGSNYEYIDKQEKALEYYNRACALDSANGNAYMARANMYKQLGDSASFDREVFHALQSPNLEVSTKLDIMGSYVSLLYTDTLQEGRIRQLFSTLETQHPGESEIHNFYAAYLFEIGDTVGVAEQMSYSVALNPNDESTWNTYIQAIGSAGDEKLLAKRAKDAMARFPNSLYFPIVAASALNALDSLPQAIALLDTIVPDQSQKHEAVSSFYAFKGDMLALNKDTLSALVAYDMSIDTNPSNYMALNNAAYFMAENDMDLDKAEQYISRVIRNDDSNPTYLDTYAWVFFKKKEYSLARQYIDMTLNLYEEMPDSAALAEAGMTEAEIDRALAEAEEDTISAEIYHHAGDIYFMVGEPAQALEFWKKALALEPDNELLQRKVKHKTFFYK